MPAPPSAQRRLPASANNIRDQLQRTIEQAPANRPTYYNPATGARINPNPSSPSAPLRGRQAQSSFTGFPQSGRPAPARPSQFVPRNASGGINNAPQVPINQPRGRYDPAPRYDPIRAWNRAGRQGATSAQATSATSAATSRARSAARGAAAGAASGGAAGAVAGALAGAVGASALERFRPAARLVNELSRRAGLIPDTSTPEGKARFDNFPPSEKRRFCSDFPDEPACELAPPPIDYQAQRGELRFGTWTGYATAASWPNQNWIKENIREDYEIRQWTSTNCTNAANNPGQNTGSDNIFWGFYWGGEFQEPIICHDAWRNPTLTEISWEPYDDTGVDPPSDLEKLANPPEASPDFAPPPARAIPPPRPEPQPERAPRNTPLPAADPPPAGSLPSGSPQLPQPEPEPEPAPVPQWDGAGQSTGAPAPAATAESVPKSSINQQQQPTTASGELIENEQSQWRRGDNTQAPIEELEELGIEPQPADTPQSRAWEVPAAATIPALIRPATPAGEKISEATQPGQFTQSPPPAAPPASTPPVDCKCNAPILNGQRVQNSSLADIKQQLTRMESHQTNPTTGFPGLYALNVEARTKLGNIGDFMQKAWETTRMQKVLDVLTFIGVMHNVSMLSRDVGETFFQIISQGAQAVGISDEEGNPLDIYSMVTNGMESFLRNTLGSDVYDGVAQTWNRANRIISTAGSVIWTIRSITDASQDLMEWVGSNTGKIGNALKRWGIVGEKDYPWMSENAQARHRMRSRFDKVTGSLENAEDRLSTYGQVTGGILEIQQEVDELGQNFGHFKQSVEEGIPDPWNDNIPIADQHAQDKSNSAAPTIDPSDSYQG